VRPKDGSVVVRRVVHVHRPDSLVFCALHNARPD
jgi:hypothetical protein